MNSVKSIARGVRLTVAAALTAALAVAAPASASPLTQHLYRIYPLGDSITLGTTTVDRSVWQSNATPGGYRAPLDQMLANVDIWHQFVGTWRINSTPLLTQRGQEWHDGHGGYRIDQVAADLAGVAGGNSDNGGHWLTGISGTRAPIYPQIVIIHLGTNDIAQRWDPARHFPTSDGKVYFGNATQRSQFVTDMTGRLGSLITSIYRLRPGAHIVLSDVVPIGITTSDSVTPVYAQAIRNLVVYEQHLGRSVTFADVYHAFVVKTGAVTAIKPGLKGPVDIYHPTPQGYQVMAGVYFDAIRGIA